MISLLNYSMFSQLGATVSDFTICQLVDITAAHGQSDCRIPKYPVFKEFDIGICMISFWRLMFGVHHDVLMTFKSSTTVGACAKFCSDHLMRIWKKAKRNSHRIWNVVEKHNGETVPWSTTPCPWTFDGVKDSVALFMLSSYYLNLVFYHIGFRHGNYLILNLKMLTLRCRLK